MSIATPQRKKNLTFADEVEVIQIPDGVLKISRANKFGCSRPHVSRTYKNRVAVLNPRDVSKKLIGDTKRRHERKEAAVPAVAEENEDIESSLQCATDPKDEDLCQEAKKAAPSVKTMATDKGTGAI
ncbi:Hypp4359 [Branchiostoma lanceolatum]|uniref:Hypp4359 protein n=1 Tax=Branchiostoma lanceolatum TaxID=7740 RepID=A0A8K0A9Y8_BRALA|nr:Hypp4359 [Branchiostoma lanceolatum]